ncbi:MAG: hypothetical protein IAB19_06100 [Proteobacteria bacterium]|uniref:Uncharacterized protein n=1 Tax=Candidatus Avisuccinivibrio stercorigallinarum TaxID=2840704 RepID=A0A9D9DCK9_9GAMM|nr:hypothetical protein [Candidatus Avisuccinivibrio stercorigallinarum]
MAVPEEIRKVKRPVNTIVDDNGGSGPYRFAVRARAKGSAAGRGPRNGKVIGHIIDGRFVSLKQRTAAQKDSAPAPLIYGSGALLHSVSSDLLQDLLQFYEPHDAVKILALASLKVLQPGITLRRCIFLYTRSVLRTFYPCTGMGEAALTNFVQALGKERQKLLQFAAKRAGALKDDDQIIIGCMPDAFPGAESGHGPKAQDLVYACSVLTGEPLCAELIPSGSLNAPSLQLFMARYNLTSGIFLAARGLTAGARRELARHCPGVHCLLPLERTDPRLKPLAQRRFEQGAQSGESAVFCKKLQLPSGSFAYSFFDLYRAYREKTAYLNQQMAAGTFDPDRLKEEDDYFGVSVFELDADLPPEQVYRCLTVRSECEELLEDFVLDDPALEDLQVQKVWEIFGAVFLDIIAAVISQRSSLKAEAAGVLNELSYGELMDDLDLIWRWADAPEPARAADGFWVHEFAGLTQILVKLGLCEPAPAEPELVTPRKPGRPRTAKRTEQPQKKRGRPRKTPAAEPEVKRPVGRPRKAEA